MPSLESRTENPELWAKQYAFEDENGKEILCNDASCDLGSYAVSDADGELHFPGCINCGFCGGLTDVFNKEESRFEPDAPENFKIGAARVLISRLDHMNVLRHGRLATVALIEEYSAK